MAQSSEPITFEQLKSQPLSGAYEMTISPDQARRIVRSTQAAEANFRKMTDDQRLAQNIAAMKSGEWIWTDADPIRLHIHEHSGEIVASDGQHRLMAAAQARRVLHTIVLWGPQWIGGLHVDQNRPRSVAQYLQHDYGLKNAAAIVAVVRLHLSRVYSFHRKTTDSYQRNRLRDEQIIRYTIENLEEMQRALSRYGAGSSRGFNSIAYACALFEFRRVDHEMADQFHEDMKDPHLDPVDPLAALKKNVAGRFNITGHRMHRQFSIDNLVKAWNMRAGNQTVGAWRNAGDDVFFPIGYKVESLDDGADTAEAV